jgi:hypothetical protein
MENFAKSNGRQNKIRGGGREKARTKEKKKKGRREKA